ncbi:MAG: hypothetical protein KatS3mg132_001 [Limisphaera sp.]|nr:MAG: hypothetical protein KatS3mg132_001 [Limisphaera sp.]
MGVAYSRKFEGVFDSVGVRDWVVDGRVVDTDQAVARVVELFRCRDEVRELLEAAADEARTTLDRVFSDLLSSHAHKSLMVPDQAGATESCGLRK